MIKLTFLGTNGFYADKNGDTLCTLIETNDFNIILDAGSGITKLDKIIDFKKKTFLFLSHLHLDHINGLFTLPKFNFKHALTIMVAKENIKALRTILAFPYIAPPSLYKYPVEILDLPDQLHSLPFRADVLSVSHSVFTLGLRMIIEDKTISFITDTGLCKNAFKLANHSDLLIAECSHRSGETNPQWPHLNPEEAGELALRSKSKKLILTHFDAAKYISIDDRLKAETIAKNIFPATCLAKDGFSMTL